MNWLYPGWRFLTIGTKLGLALHAVWSIFATGIILGFYLAVMSLKEEGES